MSKLQAVVFFVEHVEQLDSNKPPSVPSVDLTDCIGGLVCQIRICSDILATKPLHITMINKNMAKPTFKTFSGEGQFESLSCSSYGSLSFPEDSVLQFQHHTYFNSISFFNRYLPLQWRNIYLVLFEKKTPIQHCK